MIMNNYDSRTNNKNFTVVLFSSVLLFTFFFTSNSEAVDRREFLRGALSLGASPLLSGLPLSSLGGAATEVSPEIKDIAEIWHLQWGLMRERYLSNTDFLEVYVKELRKLNLVTARGQSLQSRLIARTNRQIINIKFRQQQALEIKVKSNISTPEGQQAFNSLSDDSLLYNIVLIRSLLPPSLLSKINASLAFVSPSLFVTTDEMILLGDYFLLLDLNVNKFNQSAEGYSLLLELYDDAINWFPSLTDVESNYYDSSTDNILSCGAILNL